MSLNSVAGLTCIGIALLIIAISIPLLQGKIKMNNWYGIRIRQSFRSQENWDRINRYDAKRLIFWSMIVTVVGLLLLVLPVSGILAFWLGNLVILALCVIVPLVEILRFANNL